MFSYRPADVLGALGADVEVRVEVARDGAENRAPFASPDAVRLRRDVSTIVPVLFNDVDPDGDRLSVSVVEPLPDGLTVEVQGEELSVIAGTGSADLLPFQYEIDDGFGHAVRGSVLVADIDADDPNRPPVVTADTATAVVGTRVALDVLSNDTDPDGDPLTVVSVSQPDGDTGVATAVGADGVEFTPSELNSEGERVYARFTYTVDDGNGHQVIGDVSIAVIPEPLPEPPFARDDSTFTFVDSPVTVDVLRNDGDPSAERPTLVGTPGCPAGGVAIVTADRRVQYTPPRGESGAFRCTYEVTNSQGLRDSASIIISVRERSLANEPPVANPDTLTVRVDPTPDPGYRNRVRGWRMWRGL
jgi:hypothetical protein